MHCCFSCSLGADRSSAGSGDKKWVASGLSGSVAMRCSTLLAILTAVLLYLVMGALVFNTLEAPVEEDKYNTLLQSLQDSRNEFLYSYTCVSPDSLQAFLEVQRITVQQTGILE